MSFDDIEKKRIEKALAGFLDRKRPPVHIRPQLDFGYRLSGQSIALTEIRPQWDDPSTIHERAFAKATYIKAQRVWKISWQRADLKWHSYQPVPSVPSVEEFLAVVDADECACFFG